MVTPDELERRVHTPSPMRDLSSVQHDVVLERILRNDPELAGVMSTLIATYKSAKPMRRLGPLIRDSVM